MSDLSHRATRIGLILLPLALIAAITIVLLWPAAGRSLTEFADPIFATEIPVPPVGSKLAYDGEGFRISGLSLTFGSTGNQRYDVDLHTSAANRIVLTSGGHSFVLGPRTNPIDRSGRPDLDFSPEQGDVVSLTSTRSLVGWPTPFEINFMSSTPTWKRYVYYRLVWKKRTGAQLEMRWRYEQGCFNRTGWTRPAMMWNFHTGLLSADIHP